MTIVHGGVSHRRPSVDVDTKRLGLSIIRIIPDYSNVLFEM